MESVERISFYFFLFLRQSSCDLHLMAMPCALHAWAYSANDVHKHSQSPPISHPQESNTHLLSKKKHAQISRFPFSPPKLSNYFSCFLNRKPPLWKDILRLKNKVHKVTWRQVKVGQFTFQRSTQRALRRDTFQIATISTNCISSPTKLCDADEECTYP